MKITIEKFNNEDGGPIQKFGEAIDDGTPCIVVCNRTKTKIHFILFNVGIPPNHYFVSMPLTTMN